MELVKVLVTYDDLYIRGIMDRLELCWDIGYRS